MPKILAVVAGLVLAAMAEGFALSILWGWFVVPVFHVPALRMVQAIGLALAAKVFVGTPGITASQADIQEAVGIKRQLAESVIRGIIFPFIMLALGWVYRLFL